MVLIEIKSKKTLKEMTKSSIISSEEIHIEQRTIAQGKCLDQQYILPVN